MTLRGFAAAVALTAWTGYAADLSAGDARRGEQLFQSEQCYRCHSIAGRGGNGAPDLTRTIDRNYTPGTLASLMWNHAPAMWAGMKKQGIVKASLSPDSAADLFAYFVSARYFERPGDAARGKALFAAKHCADCHGIGQPAGDAGAPPVAKWESLADPVALAQQMWNHGPKMREAFARKKLAWPNLSGAELTDILVYLQNVPETRGLRREFKFSGARNGDALFASKGCAGCHTGTNALESKLRNQSLTDIAAAMWDHQPSMKQPSPALSEEEMRDILGVIWARQYFGAGGSAAKGKRVFEEKRCSTCHSGTSGPGPQLAKGKQGYSDVAMISVLWDHGPRMFADMEQKGLPWPRFSGQQMSDLVAYLNSL